MGKKRSRADAELSPEERERRELQRATQQQAIAARARGEHYETSRRTTFPKRKPLEARKLADRIAKRKAENAARRRASQKAVKKQRAEAPDVVIVPIFWKGEAKQMARVLSACKDVEDALAGTDWNVLLDAGHKYTPGQKFAHWEHKGVLLRVEVGPREAEKGCCTVARTFKPGDPAVRINRVSVNSKTLRAQLEKAQLLDSTMQNDEDSGGDAQSDREDEQVRAKEAVPVPVQAHKRARGGDDLDDDFVAGTATSENDDGENEAVSSKRDKANASQQAAHEKAHAKGKKSSRRVVNF